jgi:hypothetical protein
MTNFDLLIKQLTETRKSILSGGANSREIPLLNKFRAEDVPNPFHVLPNVKRSWIRTNVLDPLLRSFGIAKKFTPDMRFEELSWRTHAANRYLRIMHYRLLKLLSQKDVEGYWILSLKLMRESKVIHLVALRKLNHNWHLHYPLGIVFSWLYQLKKTVITMPSTLKVYRFYQPKITSSGVHTHRPLGNPHDVHKMYYYLWQSFMVIFVYCFIGKYQHGFLPGRGTATAWAQLITMIKSPFLWEFDLEGAFPSLNVNVVCDRLIINGCPAPIANYIRSMSLATVEEISRTKQLLPEPKTGAQLILQKMAPLHHAFAPNVGLSIYGIKNRFQTMSPWAPEHVLKQPGWESSRTPSIPGVDTHAIESGFTQGSGLSPILFDFAFEDAMKRHFDTIGTSSKYQIVAYADDFLISSQYYIAEIFKPNIFPGIHKFFGFKVSEAKSRCLKTSGLWLVDSFKFLGLTYDTKKNKIIGTPRKGGFLEMDKSAAISDFVYRDRQLVKFQVAFPQYATSTQGILDAWAEGEFPFNLIPEGVITAGESLSYQSITQIAESIAGVEGKPVEDVLKMNPPSRPGYRGGSRKGKLSDPHLWLHSRLSGTILSRLYTGKWLQTTELPNVELDHMVNPRRTKGRSWWELLGHSQEEAKGIPGEIHNSTSLATLDLLNRLSPAHSDLTIKMKKDGAHYVKRSELIARRKAAALRPPSPWRYSWMSPGAKALDARP